MMRRSVFSPRGGNAALVIAEIGVNHNGSLQTALECVRSAARAGADIAKLQAYTADRLAAGASPAYWDPSEEGTRSQRELFRKFDGLTPADYERIASECQSVGIEFMATCFDEVWIRELDHLQATHKVASADITSLPLLRAIARTGKPVILSTGASTIQEVDTALAVLRGYGTEEVALLHCVLNYPTRLEDASLGRIRELSETFPECVIGYSDHTKPQFESAHLMAAYALGARVFEKHFTLDPMQPGNDHYHAMDEGSMRDFIRNLNKLAASLEYTESEFIAHQLDARQYARRGLYAARDLGRGEVVSFHDVAVLRPANGTSPMDIDLVVGHRLRRSLQEGESFTGADFERLP